MNKNLLIFLTVIFLTGCNLFGPMPLLKDDHEEVFKSDESLLIPPDVINSTGLTDEEMLIILQEPKTDFIGPLECTSATDTGCEGWII